MKIVMMGTGPFAVPTFKMLVDSEHECCLLVTRPQAVNRGRKAPPSPMRVVGNQSDIEIFDPVDVNAAESIEVLRNHDADLLIVCDYGQILSNEALATARLGGINLHGSLLPKYRGAAPVQWSVYNGDPETGVCVIHMTPRLDGGPVLCEVRTKIEDDDTAETLESRLSEMGVASVVEAIEKLSAWDGESILGELQDQAQATKAPRLKKEMGQVDWGRSAVEIRNQIRAFKPWPGCYTEFQRSPGNQVRIILDWVELVDEDDIEEVSAESTGNDSIDQNAVPGQVVLVQKKRLWVKTGHGYLSIQRLKPVGKRVMEIDEFLRGYPMSAKTVLSKTD